MLRYNEGQVLELSMNALSTRYYYLLFGIKNLHNAVESAKCVITTNILDKQLAGQSLINPFYGT